MSNVKFYTSELNLTSNNQNVKVKLDNEGELVKVKDGVTSRFVSGGNSIYSDDWFTANLTNHPPSPGLTGWNAVDVNVIQTATTIGFWVKNPEQFAFGPMLIPHINSINISIGGSGGVGNGDTVILDNNSVYLPQSSNPIKAFILSKIASTGYNPNYSFTDTSGNSTTLPTYVYGNPALDSYVIDNKINVNLWYKNSNIQGKPLNVLTVPLKSFLQAFPPSEVRNITTFGNITTTNVNLRWIAPEYTSKNPSSSVGDNIHPIKQYKVNYESVSSNKRHIYQAYSGFKETDNSNLSYTLNTLKPGTLYNIYVSAQNLATNTYGPTGTTIQIQAAVPELIFPSNLNLTLPATQYFSAKKVSDNTTITDPIYQQGSSGGNCSTDANIPIHRFNNVGSSALDISSMKFLINGTEHYRVNFNGFGNQPEWTEIYNTGYKASFNTITVADLYSSDSAYFYKKIQSIKPVLNLNNGTPLSALSDSYEAKIEYTTTDTISGFKNFYIEDLNNGPTGTASYVSDTLTPRTITGITVFGSSNTQTVTYSVNTYNIGRYFYRSDKILELTNDKGFTLTNSTSAILPDGTNSPINSPVNFTHTVNISFGNVTTPLYNIPLIPKIYNCFGTSGSSFTCNTITIPKILDRASYIKPLSTTVQTTSGDAYANSYRIKTPESYSYSGGYTVYDNSAILTSVNYTNELPIITGKYATGVFNSIYLTSVGLSSLVSETGFRYASYAWNVDMSNTNSINTIRLKFTNFSNNNVLSYDGVSNSIATNDNYKVYYRIEHYDINSVYQPDTSESTNYSTVWINANDNADTSFQFNFRNSSQNLITTGLVNNTSSSEINNPNAANFTYNLRGFALTPSDLTGQNLRIYVIIGIKMNVNIRYEDIQCAYGTF